MDDDIRRMADQLEKTVDEFRRDHWTVSLKELDNMQAQLKRLQEASETLSLDIVGQYDAVGSIDRW